jgi:hypothetical protein
MIKTLKLHNNDTTPRHNGVESIHGPTPLYLGVVSLLYSVSVRITPLSRRFLDLMDAKGAFLVDE